MSSIGKSGRAIVVFDSMFGNTAQVAKAPVGGLQMAGVGVVSCLNIPDVKG